MAGTMQLFPAIVEFIRAIAAAADLRAMKADTRTGSMHHSQWRGRAGCGCIPFVVVFF